ncbi:MAG TPA: helix-turn-helix transcriptional regulator [Thermoanaerobaculia bacterium]|jgi:transcriptional regulator with XRE-family HTH domain|nr:helix-turn-helix transcriptional regulator [Thermoanaerobaculia bacterium]
MTREAEMFGEALHRWRKKSGLSQEDLAHEARITTSYYGQLERGKKSPTLKVILKLCRALDCSPGELLADFTPSVVKRLRFD